MAAPATGGRFSFFEFKACPKFLLRRTRKSRVITKMAAISGQNSFPNPDVTVL
ncbi:hypothetical protein [Xaviernesmea oryzae]|uniref:hypothetical protein n=1 Tax=Xaviernesmea oryzae TaxID=464029 RepID=UPI00135672DF|nr:hypothetical protein [Xaviernesmea oryzae]